MLDRTHNLLGYTAKDLQKRITSHPNWTLIKDEMWHLDHISILVTNQSIDGPKGSEKR